MLEPFADYADVIGIIGVMSVLSAYFLLNMNWLSSNSICYLSLNGMGSILILFSLMFHWNLASVVIEAAWILISVIGFYRVWKKMRV